MLFRLKCKGNDIFADIKYKKPKIENKCWFIKNLNL